MNKITVILLAVAAVLIVAGGVWYLMGNNNGYQPVLAPVTGQPAASGTPQGGGLGDRCGGNMMNAPQCAMGYHCAPAAGSHLPFGDVGGTCVADEPGQATSVPPTGAL